MAERRYTSENQGPCYFEGRLFFAQRPNTFLEKTVCTYRLQHTVCIELEDGLILVRVGYFKLFTLQTFYALNHLLENNPIRGRLPQGLKTSMSKSSSQSNSTTQSMLYFCLCQFFSRKALYI